MLIVAWVFLALSMLLPYVICDVLFARETDKSVLAQDYAYLSVPPPREIVQFSSGSNELTGYLYTAEEACGLILIAHGMKGNGDSHLTEIQYFVQRGWSVFSFDGTGTGNSTGDSVVGFEQMVVDLRAALSFMDTREELSSLPIMLYGHSMGGYAAAVVAGDGGVAGVVSIAGFDSPMDIMLHNGRRYAGEVAWLGYPFLCLQNRLTFGGVADQSAVEAINASSASFLIVYGADDSVILPDESLYGNRDAIVNPQVSYLLIEEEPRDGHSEAWYSAEAMTYRVALEEELKALESRYDGAIPADILSSFAADIDRETLYEPDVDFMETVIAFYRESLS